MNLQFSVLICFALSTLVKSGTHIKFSKESQHCTEITDENWDQIQKGQWLIGFFDKETKESLDLEQEWEAIKVSIKDPNIQVGKIFAPDNPGLYVRFLVTVFPKVFYIKNGVAHIVPKADKASISNVIAEKKWSALKTVNFLSNPFSIQMSLLSHLFVYAVNLYNYEHSIVQKFVSAPSATDVVFGLTFIIVGTFLGLLLTCAFGVVQIFFMDSKEYEDYPNGEKESEDASENVSEKKKALKETKTKKKKDTKENQSEEEDSSEKSSSVRKRK
ncbi:thioredoxin-related transmembrane protein 1-like [Uloborus diversus]|uniref:thioredoxin-related transmembrane protein 1-like n=1 Tax=Uloborus diversus TaxID=327109 RepID=UPI00240A6CA7|nr:thioredoxin-related transmembrane protein 1-like [Uloborus diversus]